MMRIAVHERYLDIVDLTHRRHLYESFVNQGFGDLVSGGDLGDYDYLFGGAHKGVKTVSHLCYDPHAMPMDYDPRPLWNRRYEKLYYPGELARLLRSLELEWSRRTQPVAQNLDTIDYLCLHANWPFKQYLAPRLHHAKILRVSLSVPEWIFYPPTEGERDIDVFFLGAIGLAHPIRLYLERNLPQAPDIQSRFEHHKGPWETTEAFDEHQRWYASMLRRAKVTPFDGSIWDWPTNRYFESMACGALVVAPMPHDGDVLGFRDGVNMVVTDGYDAIEKIRYYLNHEDERRRIADAGMALCMARHTSRARSADLYRRLSFIDAGATAEEVERQYDEELAVRVP